MAFEIARAGWVFRQSSILHRWKRNWLVLYQNGDLKYFESPDSHMAEECLRMGMQCLAIKTAEHISGVDPPEGHNRKCLLSVVFRDETLNLCAESPDDTSAWHMALEQARVVQQLPQQPAPPPYTMQQGAAPVYPQQQTIIHHQGAAAAYPPQQTVVYTQYPGRHPPPYVVQNQPGQTTVIYADNPYYHRRRCDGTDVAMGVMAGAAMTSLMWGPLLWW